MQGSSARDAGRLVIPRPLAGAAWGLAVDIAESRRRASTPSPATGPATTVTAPRVAGPRHWAADKL